MTNTAFRMERFFKRLLSMEAVTVIPEVYWGLLVVFIIFLLVSAASVISQPFGAGMKALWLAVLLLLPLLGLWIYSLRCIIFADYSFLRDWGIVRNSSPTKSKI